MGKAEKRIVTVRLQSNIIDQTPLDSFEWTTRGEFFHKGDDYYIRFKEAYLTADEIQTTLKWNGEELLLLRHGDIFMRQSFIVGKETSGRYGTKEAAFETTAFTDTLRVQLPINEKKGSIEIVYRFRIQGQHTGTHHLNLTLEEE